MTDMSLKSGFSIVPIQGLGSLIEENNRLCKEVRQNPFSTELRDEFMRVSAQLGNSLEFVRVCENDQDILEQLVGHDHVHAFGAGSVEGILDKRAGDKGQNKQAFALVKPAEGKEGREVLAAIYGHMDAVPTQADGSVHCSNLKGDVHEILTADIQSVQNPNIITFYSVTAFRGVHGAASMLINRAHGHIRQNIPSIQMISTLSPSRAFKDWAQPHGDMRDVDRVELKRHLLNYVHDFKAHDLARNLHLKDNGAALAWIHTTANIAESPDDVYGDGKVVPMVNYLYDMDTLVLQQQKLSNLEGQIAVHPDLIAHLAA